MKTKIVFLMLSVSAIMFFGCSKPAQKQSAEQVLNDTVMQNQIMTAICNNHPMMMNMMAHMMQSPHAMQMMMGNTQMMHQMMQDSNFMNMMYGNRQMMGTMMQSMMNMAENDSTMGNRMAGMMMSHPNMMNMMMGMMYNNGMMDKQCMMKAQKIMGGMHGKNMMNGNMGNHMGHHN